MKPFDIAIATTTYFAPYRTCTDGDYRLRLFLDEVASMQKVDWCDKRVIWIIYDDASPKFPEIPNIGIPVEVRLREKNVTWACNLPDACTRACELAPWVINLDSDGLIAKDAIRRVFALIEQFPAAVAYGLFNTPYHHTEKVTDNYVLKASIPEHGAMFRAADYDLKPRPAHFPLLARLPEYRDPYPVLRPSGIQHTGQYGLNGTLDDADDEFQIGGASCMATVTKS